MLSLRHLSGGRLLICVCDKIVTRSCFQPLTSDLRRDHSSPSCVPLGCDFWATWLLEKIANHTSEIRPTSILSERIMKRLLNIVVILLTVHVVLPNSHSNAEVRTATKDSAIGATLKVNYREVGHPLFCSPHFAPIAIHNNRVFVVNTPSDTVDVLDRTDRRLITRVNVGIDPVSIAVRPDGKEVWVSNHISDSVSVIDNDPKSTTFLQVISTIQEIGRAHV